MYHSIQGDCGNPQCKTTRAELKKMIADYEAEKSKAARLRTAMEEMRRQVNELEHAKSEAVCEIAVAKAEVAIRSYSYNVWSIIVLIPV